MNAKASGIGSRWVWIGAVAAIVVAGGVAVALSAGGSDSSSSTSSSSSSSSTVEIAKKVTVSGTKLPTLPASGADPAIGRTAPDLTGVSFDGKSVTVTNTGKAHVVIFVAHWCPHCQAEVPRIVALASQGGITVPVTGVATGTDSSAPNYPPSTWLQREHWPYPVLVDTKSSTAATAYGLPGYPFLVFVDAQGKVVGRVSGELQPDDLAKVFKAFAAGQTLPIPGR